MTLSLKLFHCLLFLFSLPLVFVRHLPFDHGFYIRWLLISCCARMMKTRSFSEKKNRIWWLFRCNQMPSTNRNAWFTPCVRIVKWATIYYKNHAPLPTQHFRTVSLCRTIILLSRYVCKIHLLAWKRLGKQNKRRNKRKKQGTRREIHSMSIYSLYQFVSMHFYSHFWFAFSYLVWYRLDVKRQYK